MAAANFTHETLRGFAWQSEQGKDVAEIAAAIACPFPKKSQVSIAWHLGRFLQLTGRKEPQDVRMIASNKFEVRRPRYMWTFKWNENDHAFIQIDNED